MVQSKKSCSTFVFLLLLLTTALVSGCGGGGGSADGGPSLPAKTLSWQPPTSYADSTPLNPATDLDSFEIYVNENGVFSATDKADAALAAYNSGSGQVTTSFNLANLGQYLSQGIQYHVAVRAVAKNGLKSDFSPSAAFSF